MRTSKENYVKNSFDIKCVYSFKKCRRKYYSSIPDKNIPKVANFFKHRNSCYSHQLFFFLRYIHSDSIVEA